MSTESKLRVRLQGIAGALRFAFIPALCALAVAIASESRRGDVYALALGAASVVLGVVYHAREILSGRPARPEAGGTTPMSEGEWMLRLR